MHIITGFVLSEVLPTTNKLTGFTLLHVKALGKLRTLIRCITVEQYSLPIVCDLVLKNPNRRHFTVT